MKKISILFAVFFAALLCTVSACGGDKNEDEPEPTPAPTPVTPTAKYLTASEFAASNWTGKDANGNDVTLNVVSTSNMNLTYYTVNAVSKKTDEKKEVKVAVTYTFKEEDGTFSGSGDDKQSYSGSLSSKTALSLKMPNATVSMTKK